MNKFIKIPMTKIETGATFLLACPNNQLNDDYYRELNRLFKMSEKR
jgi:hypothetical protein